jgi:hypothetical protein
MTCETTPVEQTAPRDPISLSKTNPSNLCGAQYRVVWRPTEGADPRLIARGVSFAEAQEIAAGLRHRYNPIACSIQLCMPQSINTATPTPGSYAAVLDVTPQRQLAHAAQCWSELLVVCKVFEVQAKAVVVLDPSGQLRYCSGRLPVFEAKQFDCAAVDLELERRWELHVAEGYRGNPWGFFVSVKDIAHALRPFLKPEVKANFSLGPTSSSTSEINTALEEMAA